MNSHARSRIAEALLGRMLLIAILTICIVQGQCYAADDENSPLEQQFLETNSNIQASAQARDLDSLEKLADQVEQEWPARNMKYYGGLMKTICDALSSYNYKDPRQHELERKYALRALEKAAEKTVSDEPQPLSPQIEVHLLGHLFFRDLNAYSTSKITGEDFARERSSRAKLALGALKRQLDEFDPKWDPMPLPESWPEVPGVRSARSAAAPESIKDPVLRATYEAALERNRQRNEEHNRQYELRGFQKLFWPKVEQYIIRLYSKPPYNTEELEIYLRDYVKDPAMRARILDQVGKPNGDQKAGSANSK